MKTNFVKQVSFDVEYSAASITNWRSSRTGLQLVYINKPSPLVSGNFVVATEIANDSGCPHTLEHLIFMGSKNYSYKGLLDCLSNRFFSSTNAWTSVDQTVYTLSSAGWEGFKTLLPIYLEHVFYPTLTDEACLTEVYHIDGEGKEKGVVFSEMQGIESEAWFVSLLNMQRTLYDKNSGYSSETGGLMKELRTLTNDQIRDFHKELYRPDNVCVIVTGTVDEEELIHIMTSFDSTLPSLPASPRKRPFVDSKHDMPLMESVIKDVEFASKDLSMGELMISWIGPLHNDHVSNLALEILGSFFTDSAISLFNKNIIEIEDPLATDVTYSTDDFYRTTINFSIGGVPTSKLNEVDTKIKNIIFQQTQPENLDITYLKDILKQMKLRFLNYVEQSPMSFIENSINSFIYGQRDGSTLKKNTIDLADFEVLESWSKEEWSSFIKKSFVDIKPASVLNRPSSKLYEKLKEDKKKHYQEIRQHYGPEGLKKLALSLQKAREKNDLEIPNELLTKFERPDVTKISFINTKSYRGGCNNTSIDVVSKDKFDMLLKNDCPADFPLFFHFEYYESEFITINVVMSSKKVKPELLKYMSLIEQIFTFPLTLPGEEYVPYETVISQMNADLIEYSLDNGFNNQFLEVINMKLKFHKENYNKAIQWILKVMKYSTIDEKRTKILVENIVNSLNEKKRYAEQMMYSAQHRYLYNDHSLRKAQDCINTEHFYESILDKIEGGDFEVVKNEIEELKNQLFSIDNMKLFIIGDSSQLRSPISAWSEFVSDIGCRPYIESSMSVKFPQSHQFKSISGKKCSEEAVLVSIPSCESNYMISCTPIPTEYLEEDTFKITLAAEYLSAVEGPFWRSIRGAGLAYGASIMQSIDTGFLNFDLYRASDGKEAWTAGKTIVDDYATGRTKFEVAHIKNAVSTIAESLANNQSYNYESAAHKILDNVFKGRGPHFVRFYLEKLNQITPEDLLYVTSKYFAPLFTPAKSVLFAALPPSDTDSFQKFLEDIGYSVTIEILNEDEDSETEGHCSSCDSGSSTDDDSDLD